MAMRLGHVHIKTREDPQKVARFYIDNFGATVKRETPDRGCQLAGLADRDLQTARRQSVSLSERRADLACDNSPNSRLAELTPWGWAAAH
jgi:hypothetical protein